MRAGEGRRGARGLSGSSDSSFSSPTCLTGALHRMGYTHTYIYTLETLPQMSHTHRVGDDVEVKASMPVCLCGNSCLEANLWQKQE